MVEILLATYNGEKYLKEQLDSLEKQTYSDWKLIVRDDCSKDKTRDILESFKKKNPQKVKINYNKENLGHYVTFFKLLEESTAEYVFLCDQDDIWQNNKIERALSFVKDKNIPTLYHSDQKLIDEKGNIIHNSAIEKLKKGIIDQDLKEYLDKNIVAGCTTCLNKKLMVEVLKLDRNLYNIKNYSQYDYHDYIIAIIAKATGEIVYDSYPTMQYRIHSENASIKKSQEKKKKQTKRQKFEMRENRRKRFIEILKFYKRLGVNYNLEVEKLITKLEKHFNKNYWIRFIEYCIEKL